MALVTSEPAAAGSSPAATPASDLAVQLEHVRRGFGEKPALVDLSISAPTGTITVLLGPNGAGKTTAVRMITGALVARVAEPCACSASTRASTVRRSARRCGVVSAKPALYDRLSGRDNLAYSAELYRVSHAGIAPGRGALRHRGRARSAGGRLLDRHEDAAGAGAVGAARSRAAALRRADVGPRSRVVASRCST